MIETQPCETLKILIVEDEQSLLGFIAENLTQFGFLVFPFVSGSEALRFLRDNPVDLVLLDWMMPEKTGLEVLQEIRIAFSRIQLPVIMITSRNQNRDIIQALKVGANDFIVKPFDVSLAKARIDAQLAMTQSAGLSQNLPQPTVNFKRAYNGKERIAGLSKMKSDMARGIENDEFQLYYQAIVSLKTGALEGAEALLRWEHPRFGILEPRQFFRLCRVFRAV